MSSADVVIIGGGAVGAAVAYFLTGPTGRDAGFTGKVTVLEPDPSYERSATARSVASLRLQFSTPENIRMSAFGSGFFRRAREHLAIDGEAVDVGWHAGAYLFLATQAGYKVLEQNYVTQIGEGARIVLLTPQQLRAQFPWLSVDDIAAGTLGIEGEGRVDGYALLMAFRKKAQAQGAVFVSEGATAIRQSQDGRISEVVGSGGSVFPCTSVVNAAGAHSAAIAALAGLDLPVHSRKRCVFTFKIGRRLGLVPLTIDPSGVYFRAEGDGFLCGVSPPPEADPDTDDIEVDWPLFEERILPVLVKRVPAFEALKTGRAWAGHYDVNLFDQNALLGALPAVPNLFHACGFSGHGLQHAPAMGRAIAELVLYGRFISLDLRRLSPQRILDSAPLAERVVV